MRTAALLPSILAIGLLYGQDRFIAEPAQPEPQTRIDHVGADLRTPAVPSDNQPFARTVVAGPHGVFRVRIRSAQLIQRMEGTYLDSALTVPHGRFIYYHPNGRIESVGDYDHGVKVGTWYTQDPTGESRAERSYSGLSGEDLLVAAGVQQLARTTRDR